MLEELLHVNSNSLLFLHLSSTARTLRTVGYARLALASGDDGGEKENRVKGFYYWKEVKKRTLLSTE